MARQNINIGVNVNDTTGDTLRDAMKKVNDNLIELFSRTGGDATQTATDIVITGNVLGINSDLTITTNSAGNLTIAAPTRINSDTIISGTLSVGTTDVDANNKVLINGNLKVRGNTTLGDNIVDDRIILNSTVSSTIEPTNDITYDIGTVSSRYRNIYVGGTISTASIATPNANISGGSINNTVIGGSIPSIGHFSTLYATGDSFLGNLLIRNNMISNGIPNENIEIRPTGTANVYVSTKLIVGSGSTPMVNPVLQATGNADNFSQIGVQNTNNGKFACSDIVVFTNDGSDFFNFADIGQNNSGWDGSLQYVYFDSSSAAFTWQISDTLVQYDLTDGSSILARGLIDEIVENPGTPSEIRVRVSSVFEGTTGIFEQGSVSGDVYNERDWSQATPKDHVLETFLATGEAKYDLGIHTLNGSTAKAAFSPTVVLAPDSVEVKVDGVKQAPGIDYTIQFSKILFYNVPTPGSTITVRQYPDANYPFTVGQSGHSYLYNNGGKFTVGTMTGHDLLFHVNGIRYTAEAGRIKAATKNWIFGDGVTSSLGFEDTGEKIQVRGNARITGNMLNQGDLTVNGNTLNQGDLTVNGNIIISNRTISSSTGSFGDVAGMIAIDSGYIYSCYADYDGSSQIWNRIQIASLPW